MVAKLLSRSLIPALLLTAGCQIAATDEPGTSEAFSTDGPPSLSVAPEPSEDLPVEDGDAFNSQCEAVADEVAYCQSELPLWDPEADVATACAPSDPAIGLACCNAFDADHCAAVCEAGDVAEAGDLDELLAYLGGSVTGTSRVIATCGSTDAEGLVAAEAGADSELLSSYGLDDWGQATARPVDTIGGLFLESFEEARRMLDDLGHDDELVAWSFDQQIGTDEGEFFLTKWVFFYPQTGVVVVLEGAVGFI